MIVSIFKHISYLLSATKSKTNSKIKFLLFHAKLHINRRPGLRRVILAIFVKFPSIERLILQKNKTKIATKLNNLTPREYCIYKDLKKAIETLKKDVR
jgi:hypothetical protein